LKKAIPLEVSNDGVIVHREALIQGMNPTVMTSQSFTKKRNHFRVEIVTLGNWCGIGICEEHFQVADGKTLGTQRNCINAAYFYQNTGINRLQMRGEVSIDNAEPLQAGDIVDILLDFNLNRLYFFRNQKLQGYIAPTQSILLEDKIFPACCISAGTTITLRNYDPVELELSQKIKKMMTDEDVVDWTRPKEAFPTSWKWGAKRKAEAIELSPDHLFISRGHGGNNPAALTQYPLTRNSSYFVAEIKKMGLWLGIGIADSSFQVNGSKTLGQQTNGINSAYFCQGLCVKLQMFGELSIHDIEPIKDGDLISIKVHFDDNCISYFNNDVLQGTIYCVNSVLKEGKIFPCCDLSSGSEVLIRNTDHIPKVVKHI